MEIWSYTPSDFLLFSSRVYFRLFELRNTALWPLQFLTIGVGFVLIYMTIRPTPRRHRAVLHICGWTWIWIAWSFFWTDYATINWTAVYFAPFAALQGVLLIISSIAHQQFHLLRTSNAATQFSLAILIFAVVAYPLIAPLTGRPWMAAEVFGITPDPTAVATVAILALTQSRARWLLMVIPVFWCAMTGITLGAMGTPEYVVAPLCALAAVITAMRPHQR